MERFERRGNVEKRSEQKDFFFEEIKEIEPVMINLATQMKEKLESGKYDILISDDTGGRIPTLVFRRILKRLHPEKKLGTYFLASGKDYLPDQSDVHYEEWREYVSKMPGGKGNALLITQYLHSGTTISNLEYLLSDAGMKNIDIASVAQEFDHIKSGSARVSGNIYLRL